MYRLPEKIKDLCNYVHVNFFFSKNIFIQEDKLHNTVETGIKVVS